MDGNDPKRLISQALSDPANRADALVFKAIAGFLEKSGSTDAAFQCASFAFAIEPTFKPALHALVDSWPGLSEFSREEQADLVAAYIAKFGVDEYIVAKHLSFRSARTDSYISETFFAFAMALNPTDEKLGLTAAAYYHKRQLSVALTILDRLDPIHADKFEYAVSSAKIRMPFQDWQSARNLLLPLVQQAPKPILSRLADLAYIAEDLPRYREALRGLTVLEPDAIPGVAGRLGLFDDCKHVSGQILDIAVKTGRVAGRQNDLSAIDFALSRGESQAAVRDLVDLFFTSYKDNKSQFDVSWVGQAQYFIILFDIIFWNDRKEYFPHIVEILQGILSDYGDRPDYAIVRIEIQNRLRSLEIWQTLLGLEEQSSVLDTAMIGTFTVWGADYWYNFFNLVAPSLTNALQRRKEVVADPRPYVLLIFTSSEDVEQIRQRLKDSSLSSVAEILVVPFDAAELKVAHSYNVVISCVAAATAISRKMGADIMTMQPHVVIDEDFFTSMDRFRKERCADAAFGPGWGFEKAAVEFFGRGSDNSVSRRGAWNRQLAPRFRSSEVSFTKRIGRAETATARGFAAPYVDFESFGVVFSVQPDTIFLSSSALEAMPIPHWQTTDNGVFDLLLESGVKGLEKSVVRSLDDLPIAGLHLSEESHGARTVSASVTELKRPFSAFRNLIRQMRFVTPGRIMAIRQPTIIGYAGAQDRGLFELEVSAHLLAWELLALTATRPHYGGLAMSDVKALSQLLLSGMDGAASSEPDAELVNAATQ